MSATRSDAGMAHTHGGARSRAGRKRKPSPVTCSLTLTCDATMRDRVRELAAARDMSVGEWMREAVCAKLEGVPGV